MLRGLCTFSTLRLVQLCIEYILDPELGAVARSRAFYGQGVGLIHLDDLMCTGFEQSLFDCTFDPTHNCLHSEDAGVVCQPERECMNY